MILTSSSDELYSESDSDASDIANNLLLSLFNQQDVIPRDKTTPRLITPLCNFHSEPR